MEFIDFEIDTMLGSVYINVECCIDEGELVIERVTTTKGADISDMFDDDKLYGMVEAYLRDCGEYV